MTREEILQIAKPMLFNTDMVRAILDDKKTATRRLIKPQHLRVLDSPYHKSHPEVPDNVLIKKLCNPPYKPGDYLYVRETWMMQSAKRYDALIRIGYRAGGKGTTIYFPNGGTDSINRVKYDAFIGRRTLDRWYPSIHMPKEAARIFLRVKDIRVERLQDITEHEAELEGCSSGCIQITGGPWGIEDDPDVWTAKDEFIEVWNSTITKKDRDKYRWEANPWVWVIEFERCDVSDV